MMISDMLPKMIIGNELKERMKTIPKYSREVSNLDAGTRLLKLNDLYKIFIPTKLVEEIYVKIYLMTSNSLDKKCTKDMIRQLNANHMDNVGVITGMTSSTIIAPSGLGKTSAIEKSISMLNDTIIIKEPYLKICPIVMVTCPFDANYKGLLLNILSELDNKLDTNYLEKAQKSSMNSQQLMALIRQICSLHVGVLIIDEIQFLAEHNGGRQLLRMILQLVNSSGINVIMVGTNECIPFFTQVPQISRRTTGLQFNAMDYNDEFIEICECLFNFQYTQKFSPLTPAILLWLYEHSAGITASLVALVHDAQEIAIIDGEEEINIKTLEQAYNNRLKMLHTYISPNLFKPIPSKSKSKKTMDFVTKSIEEDSLIENHIIEAKEKKLDIIEELKKDIKVIEVAI